VICDLGTVTKFADISVVVLAHKIGLVTERSLVVRGEPDAETANNSLLIFSTVVLPILRVSDASLVEGDTAASIVFKVG
jgi:hypothetical protein